MRTIWLAVLAVAAGCSGQIDRKQLYAAVRDLHGLAAETRLMLGLAERGSTTSTFLDEQREFLAGEQRDAVKDLERDATDPALEPLRQRALAAAHRLAPLIESARDPHQLDASVAELTELEEAATP